MSTRHADRLLSVYPIIGLGFLSLGVRLDVLYTLKATPRGDPPEDGADFTGTPRHWCLHWSVACGSWQTGGSLCQFFEDLWRRMGDVGKRQGGR